MAVVGNGVMLGEGVGSVDGRPVVGVAVVGVAVGAAVGVCVETVTELATASPMPRRRRGPREKLSSYDSLPSRRRRENRTSALVSEPSSTAALSVVVT